ncbi:transmembrane protein 220 isoform X2 [Pleurodeles waltl]|uniref:transmembrane protein 220 isoform X2 n=1 Tax=Pleurodeles waltl TaxID=8319 RepID=UPI0037096CC8
MAMDGQTFQESRPASQAQGLWRGCNFCMSLFFGIAAYVQLAYSIPAALSMFVSLNPQITDNILWRGLSDLHSVACILWSIYLAWYLIIHTKRSIIHEEEGRELSGLLIITAWMILCRSTSNRSIGRRRLTLAAVITLLPFVSWLYIYVNKEMRKSWPSHCKTVI